MSLVVPRIIPAILRDQCLARVLDDCKYCLLSCKSAATQSSFQEDMKGQSDSSLRKMYSVIENYVVRFERYLVLSASRKSHYFSG